MTFSLIKKSKQINGELVDFHKIGLNTWKMIEPYLSADLISALTCLQVHNFTHVEDKLIDFFHTKIDFFTRDIFLEIPKKLQSPNY